MAEIAASVEVGAAPAPAPAPKTAAPTRNGSSEWKDKDGRPWQPGAGMMYRRYGKTGLMLPIFSCGGMRFMVGPDLPCLRGKFGGRYLCTGLAMLGMFAAGAAVSVGAGLVYKALVTEPPVDWGFVSAGLGAVWLAVLVATRPTAGTSARTATAAVDTASGGRFRGRRRRSRSRSRRWQTRTWSDPETIHDGLCRSAKDGCQ